MLGHLAQESSEKEEEEAAGADGHVLHHELVPAV